MWISKYFVFFIIYSCMGWIYETIYCTIKKKKWDNRGFLYGPACPIYGFGAVGITIVVDFLSQKADPMSYTWWQIFIISFFGSIVLEYVTSWTLEKLFHAYWWDYSNMPLNIHGRVCFPCSVGFGFAGILVVYIILPFTRGLTKGLSPLELEAFSLLFMGVFAADLTLTVSALTHFEKAVESAETSINDYMENFVNGINDGSITPATVLETGKLAAAEKISGVSAKLESGVQLLSEKLPNNPVSLTKEQLESTKKRVEEERIGAHLSTLGIGSISAIRRVEGYRPAKGKPSRMNSALSYVKNKVVKKDKV